jgi:hypothetical protein
VAARRVARSGDRDLPGFAFMSSSNCWKFWYGEFGLTLTIGTCVTDTNRWKSESFVPAKPSTGYVPSCFGAPAVQV